MGPVAVAVIGTRLRPTTVAFMGWFGPRGLASVVFTLHAVEEIEQADGGGPLLQTLTPGSSCFPLCCTVFRRRPWPSGTAPMSGNREMSRRKASASEPRTRLRDLAGRHRPDGQHLPETP